MQTILLIRFLIRRRLEYSVRFCCIRILIIEVDNKVRTAVSYRIVQLFRSIVVVCIVCKENLIL